MQIREKGEKNKRERDQVPMQMFCTSFPRPSKLVLYLVYGEKYI